MSGRFRTKPLTLEAVQFDGTNAAGVTALIPSGAATVTQVYREPALLVETPGRLPRILHPGDWISWDGSDVTLHSDQSFSRIYEPIPG